MEVKDDGKLNPIIVISPDEFLDWVRQKADEAGFGDRQLCAIQTSLDGDDTVLQGAPQVVVMASNIAGSRS